MGRAVRLCSDALSEKRLRFGDDEVHTERNRWLAADDGVRSAHGNSPVVDGLVGYLARARCSGAVSVVRARLTVTSAPLGLGSFRLRWRSPLRLLLTWPSTVTGVCDLLAPVNSLARTAGDASFRIVTSDLLRTPLRALRQILVSSRVALSP